MRILILPTFLSLFASPVEPLPQEEPHVDPTEVNKAIKKGVSFLKDEAGSLKPIRMPRREQAVDELVMWTLLHAGVSDTDPVFQKLFDKMLDSKLDSTYRVSLQAMVLEEVDRVTFQWRIAQCAQFLADNQCANGQWSYGEPSLYTKDIPTGSRQRKKVRTGTTDKDGKRKKPRVRRRLRIKKRREGRRSGDNSNSQYAALGLRACHEAGIRFDKILVQKAKGWWEQNQQRDGGWDYGGMMGPRIRKGPEGPGGSYGSMTAGAIASLAILEHLLGRKPKRNRGIKKGLKWLGREFSVTRNPKKGRHYYYYIYAAERAGVLAGTERFGKHWWYAAGANKLLRYQSDEGSWGSRGGNRVIWETCFAILFLRRATQPLEDVETGGRRKK